MHTLRGLGYKDPMIIECIDAVPSMVDQSAHDAKLVRKLMYYCLSFDAAWEMAKKTNYYKAKDTYHKIKFDKPDAAVRQKIWQQMIPELTDDDVKQLASTFDFSGGQIENIARKHSINMVLYGEQANLLDTLMEYAAAEKISSKRICNRIGF